MSYDDAKRHLVTGAALNALERENATNRILPTSEVLPQRVPGTGTYLRLSPSARRGSAWQLVPGAAPGTYDVLPGSLMVDLGYGHFAVDISGMTGLELVAPGVLYLEIDDPGSGEAEMKLSSGWAGMPVRYEYQLDDDDLWQFVAYRYPLWQFFAADPENERSVRLGDAWAIQLVFWDLQLDFGVWERRNESGDVIIPPVAAPFFAPAAALLL